MSFSNSMASLPPTSQAMNSLRTSRSWPSLRVAFFVDADDVIEVAQYNVKATGHVAKLRKDLGLDAA